MVARGLEPSLLVRVMWRRTVRVLVQGELCSREYAWVLWPWKSEETFMVRDWDGVWRCR